MMTFFDIDGKLFTGRIIILLGEFGQDRVHYYYSNGNYGHYSNSTLDYVLRMGCKIIDKRVK